MWMLNAAGLAGVAQLGQSVRLIIERSRARIPPPALFLHSLFEFNPVDIIQVILTRHVQYRSFRRASAHFQFSSN